jgi:hypothetical protein
LKRGFRDSDKPLVPSLQRDLFSLIVYGYCQGPRASREIEVLFEDSIEARILFPLDPPDRTTIDRFRKDNEKELADLFLHTLKKANAAFRTLRRAPLSRPSARSRLFAGPSSRVFSQKKTSPASA